MNPDAPSFFPTFIQPAMRRRVYSREALKRLEPLAIDMIRSSPMETCSPALRLPVGFAALLSRLPHADEVLNVKHVAMLVESGHVGPSQPCGSVARGGWQPCQDCARGPEGCEHIRGVIAGALRQASSSRLAAVLLQSGSVIWGLIQLALAFEARQSSFRLRLLAERHPNVVPLIREYLCGEGYHMSLPKVTDHEQWRVLNATLKFDWIRDNRTRVFTEISKRWKARHTQFEQFVHFFGYRDAQPKHQVKTMLTHCAKPVFVSILSGDVVAVVLLARMGFFVPPDYYWNIFPHFAESLLRKGNDGTLYLLMRHLCLHFSVQQQALGKHVYNPIEPPPQRP
uniref:Uncharacterized protein n=1 Tax=Trypanosoma congolense (strain IL3000) TaxID=1068625 RepID=G0UXM5_TRYCI|nr:conserved hypothetical protein [Trypanosoma congolense IL3000]